MIFQPTYVFPSSSMVDGSSTIDGSVDNVFCAKINALVKVEAYQIVIYKNDLNSTEVYDSEIITTSTALCTMPFYPYTYDGEEILFKYLVPANTIENSYPSGYKWIIKLWSSYSADNPDNGCTTSVEHAFYAKPSPTLYIEQSTSVIESINGEWSASYSGSPIMWFQWILKSGDEIIADTGKQYYVSELKYTNSSLTNNTDYSLQCIVRNQDGVLVESTPLNFSVSYQTIDTTASVEATARNDGGVLVSWGHLKDISGESSSTISYKNDYPLSGLTCVDNDGIITFVGNGDFDIDADDKTHHFISFMPRSSGELYRYSDEDRVVKVSISSFNPALYAASSTLPNLSLHPSAGSYVLTAEYNTLNKSYVVSATIESVAFTNIVVYLDTDNVWHMDVAVYGSEPSYKYLSTNSAGVGKSVGSVPTIKLSLDAYYNYVMLTENEHSDIFNDLSITPSWMGDTVFLCSFEDSLNAGNALWGTGAVMAWRVFRTDLTTNKTKLVAEVSKDKTKVVDHSACSDASYQYTIMAISSTDTSIPLLSNVVNTEFCKFILMVCDKTDVKHQYSIHNIVDFEYNMNDVNMSNNTTINKINGYGKYFNIQRSSLNAITATLSSLLGVIDEDGTYRDDIDMFDLVCSLSTDARDKYLKDPRGHIWKVQVSSPVQMTIQNSDNFRFVKQLEVAQVGDASKDMIIGW